MGGAGAGLGGLLLVAFLFVTPLVWLLAAAIAWILVLPKWTGVAAILSVFSCGPLAIVSYSEPGSIPGNVAAALALAFSAGAIMAIPGVLAFRVMTIFRAATAPKK